MADGLIARGVPIPVVRKGAQSLAMLVPATLLACLQLTDNPTLAIALITLSKGFANFVLVGQYCTHADMCPKYSSVLLGMTNTTGSLPGIVGIVLVGWMLDQTHSWFWSLFAPSIFFMVTGALVYIFLASTEPQDFDSGSGEPLAVERWVAKLRGKQLAVGGNKE